MSRLWPLSRLWPRSWLWPVLALASMLAVAPVGAWQPMAADARYSDRTVLMFSEEGRFAALVAHDSRPLNAASGSWMLADDGGELVLAFDDGQTRRKPGTTRYLQMLLLGGELHPYPGTERRSPLAATSWHRVDDAFSSGAVDRASR